TKEHAKNALIVLDHFHVKKYRNDAVDTVRTEEPNKARKADDPELVSLLSCNKRFILMQNKPSKRWKISSISLLILMNLSISSCCSKTSFSRLFIT
ncbi:MAG TPA: transposase, partial [Nitrospirota bacterium]|nr:transposase [Nitrospirota bacterium]